MSDARRVEALFFRALELPAEERPAFLEHACGGNPDLLSEVTELLAADAESREFLESPVVDTDDLLRSPTQADYAGRMVGPYRLIRLLGSGGMGLVYLAERADGSYEQQVAIKLIQRGLNPEQALKRFAEERQTLARLEHPGIARLIDGGTSADGDAYLAMEYVDGDSLDAYCAERSASIEDRLDLFLQVCSAAAYAHRSLVIHRDLKPGNILVNAQGRVKLLDFGIAKIMDPLSASGGFQTVTAFRVLTPQYASPEHIAGEPMSTGSDVYSLGVILYELLAGTPPFELGGKPTHEILALIEKGPTHPATQVTGPPSHDLDTIVQKAMQPDPGRRYTSVEQLADDVRRYLRGLPVTARPDTWSYRAARFARRNRLAVAAGALAVFALLAASIGGTLLAVRANRARDAARVAQMEAESQRNAAEQINMMLREMLSLADPETAKGRDTTLMRELLDQSTQRIDRELSDQPLVAADLHQTIGTTYQNLSLYDEALEQMERALELRRSHLEPGDSLIAASLLGLGNLHADRSELDLSEARYREAYREAVAAHGPRHPQTAQAIMHIGIALQANAKSDSAEIMYSQALTLQRELLPPDHPDLGATLNNYGEFLIHERPADAGPLLREALKVQREYNTPLGVTYPIHNLASWLRRYKQEYEEAESLFRENLALFRRQLPANHPKIAVCLNNLGGTLEDAGKLEEAETAYREAWAIERSRLGREHVDYGTTSNNLARLLRTTGQLEESDRLFQEAVHAYETSLGPDHIWVGIVLGNYAQLLETQERWDEADRTAARSVAIRKKVWAEDHWRMASILGIRGACTAARGRFAEAEPVLLHSLEVVEHDLPQDHVEVRLAVARLERLYRTWGRSADADAYAARLHQLVP